MSPYSQRYNYPNTYRVNPLREQITILVNALKLDGSFAYAYAEQLGPLPQGAEGWFALPRWERLPGRRYSYALENLLNYLTRYRLVDTVSFSGEIHRSTEEQRAFDVLARQQRGDIVIVSAQFGIRRSGQGQREILSTLDHNEFPLGTFAVTAMLLTHPEREIGAKQLHVGGSSDTWVSAKSDELPAVRPFIHSGASLKLGNIPLIRGDERIGWATGFLPEV